MKELNQREPSLNVKMRQKSCADFGCTLKLTSLDMYRRPFYFLMPGRTEYYRSVLGTIFSFITVLTIMISGSFKFVDLVA